MDDSLAPSVILACARTPFLEKQRVFDAAYGHNRHYWKGHFTREPADELVEELCERSVALGRRRPVKS